MVKLKKRKKSSRNRGNTSFRGARKKARGKGHKGGKGMSGSGKRADQKKTYIFRYKHPYFGRAGRKRTRKRENKINVGTINDNLENFVNNGRAEKGKGYKIILKDYKVLGNGEIEKSVEVHASSFSKLAKEKIEKAGGKAVDLRSSNKKSEK